MKTLCEVFQKIKPEVIDEVKQLVKNGFFRKKTQERVEDLKKLIERLSFIYEVPEPELRHDPRLRAPLGLYDRINEVITIGRPSIVTTLHEYRHHMQNKGFVIIENREHDAQGWATSLYKKACPGLFRKAVATGRIKGLTISRNGEIVNS